MMFKFAMGAFLISLVVAGCAAPAAQETQATSNTSTATPSLTASADGMPTLPPPTPTATSEPTSSPAPTLAFEAPDEILPPGSLVVVSVDTLQLRAEPGLGATVVGTASEGDRFAVSFVFGPVVADGLDWYRLGTAGDSVLWAAAGSGSDRYLEVVASICPEGDPDLATLIDMANDWDRLACFGDRSLTIEGTIACLGCDGGIGGPYEPFWLANLNNQNSLWPDYRGRSDRLEVRFAPDLGLEFPAQGSIVRVTGHFNDPASTTCSMLLAFEGEEPMAVDPRTAELYCRERFVVDAFEVIGTDPDFP